VELAVAQGALETTRRDYARLQRGLAAERTAQQSVSPVEETSDASSEPPKSKNGKSDGHGAERLEAKPGESAVEPTSRQ
jgi:hypothetical protein